MSSTCGEISAKALGAEALAKAALATGLSAEALAEVEASAKVA